jgi:tRNA (guanine6-N2)-methyltransferase
LTFDYSGDLFNLEALKTIAAAYIVLDFDIPRPKALLGHENFTRLLKNIDKVIEPKTYRTLAINAAGSQSSVMQRIKQEIAQSLNLEILPDTGDLYLRIRRTKHNWQVLIRTTPRPLATRDWRMYDMPGALNGPLAHAMTLLSDVKSDDTVVNLMCGSGTLLIELLMQERNLEYTPIGIDYSADVLAGARENIQQANVIADFVCGNIINAPFRSNFADVVIADLPFGQLVGSHDANTLLYPQVMQSAYRILKTNGKFVFITHEVKLAQKSIQDRLWSNVEEIIVSQRGLHPRIFILRKRG